MGSRSPSLVRFFWLLLALPAIQGGKTVSFKVVNEAKRSSYAYLLGSSTITVRHAESTMRAAFDAIKRKLFKAGDPFAEKNQVEITLRVVKQEGHSFDPSSHEITVSVDYFKEKDAKGLKKDFTRKIYYAMTLVFLAAEGGERSDQLKNGIADFVVLENNYAPADWAKAGEGNSWFDSSQVTAQFLKYCETHRPGFVSTLIAQNPGGEDLTKVLTPWWEGYKKAYSKA